MDIKTTTMTPKLKNQKVKIYQEKDKTYLSIKGEEVLYEKGKCINCTVELFKIDINDFTIKIKRDYIDNGFYIPRSVGSETCSVIFQMLPNKDGKSVKLAFEEKPKQMTKEQIEKELGYKIDII